MRAQESGSSLEFYVEGKKYESIGQYKELRKKFLLDDPEDFQEESDGQSSEDFIGALLNLTLERFTDEDLKLFVEQLQSRRKDLFVQGEIYRKSEVSPGLKELNDMTKEHMISTQQAVDIELNPSKMKTIMINNETSQVQEMINEFNKSKPRSASINLDPARIKTIIIKQKGADKKNVEKINSQMVLAERNFTGLSGKDMENLIKEMKTRSEGPLSSRYEQIHARALAEKIKILPQVLYAYLSGSGRFVSGRSNSGYGLTKEEFKWLLGEVSKISQQRAYQPLPKDDYDGFNLTNLKQSLLSDKPYPLLMNPDEVKKFSNFLHYRSQVEQEKERGKYRPIKPSDDILGQISDKELENRRNTYNFRQRLRSVDSIPQRSSEAGMGENAEDSLEGLRHRAVNKSVRITSYSSEGYNSPIIIDRDTMNQGSLKRDIDVNKVLNFKTLLMLQN